MTQHLKKFYVSEDLLIDLFKPSECLVRRWVCYAGLPEDARVVSVHADWERKAIGVVVEHPSFPLVKTGEVIPTIEAEAHVEYHQWPNTATC